MISQLHLLRPWWILMLLPISLLVWRLSFFQALSNSWHKACNPGLLKYLLVNRVQKHSRWPLYLLALAWLISIIALAGPTWSRMPQTVYRTTRGEVVVFDLSPNMLATDIKPSRLERAKFKLMDLSMSDYLRKCNQNSADEMIDVIGDNNV